jgi:hypothetical protein
MVKVMRLDQKVRPLALVIGRAKRLDEKVGNRAAHGEN